MNNQQEKMLLNAADKRELKKLAHHLKPIVQIGKKGVTDALIQEIDTALLAHELVKVHIAKDQKDNLKEDLDQILAKTMAHHIDTIGARRTDRSGHP